MHKQKYLFILIPINDSTTNSFFVKIMFNQTNLFTSDHDDIAPKLKSIIPRRISIYTGNR